MTPQKIDVKVVAEIGCNHMGDWHKAEQMIYAAARAGAWAVKFQKRNPRECLTPEQYAAPYVGPQSFGPTYGAHREMLEFNIATHAKFVELCSTLGIKYATSVWDATSFWEVLELKKKYGDAIPYIKIPSAKNESRNLMEMCEEFWPGDVHVSNGMIDREHEIDIVDILQMKCVLYACTSKYPAEHEDIRLMDIPRLQLYPVKSVGFSGHHKGIAMDIAAAVLGAEYIERHFTLDRTWKGTDQAASLEPQGLDKLVRDLHGLEQAWGMRTGVLDCELETRKKLKGK